jgi:hypothetical protein
MPEKPTLAETVTDLSHWAWGANGRIGVDETLREIKNALLEQKGRDRLLGICILVGVVLANPITTHLAEPWLRMLGK